MQTLKIELEDNIYLNLVQSGINIQEKFKEFLLNLNDNEEPAITSKEAKKRISKAVKNYKNSTGTYFNESEYQAHINKTVQKLKTKYANN